MTSCRVCVAMRGDKEACRSDDKRRQHPENARSMNAEPNCLLPTLAGARSRENGTQKHPRRIPIAQRPRKQRRVKADQTVEIQVGLYLGWVQPSRAKFLSLAGLKER